MERRALLREASVKKPEGALRAYFGRLPVDEIRKPLLLEWWAAEVEGRGRAAKTGRNYLDVLSGIFNYARELDLTEGNPVDEFRKTLRRRCRTQRGRAASESGRDVSPIEQPVEIAKLLKSHGCDIVDVSAGQTVPTARPVYGRQFQTPFSDRIRHEAKIPTMAVGNISSYGDGNAILASGRADLCVMARAHLYNPYWTRHAAKELGVDLPWPAPYSSMDRYTPRFK